MLGVLGQSFSEETLKILTDLDKKTPGASRSNLSRMRTLLLSRALYGCGMGLTRASMGTYVSEFVPPSSRDGALNVLEVGTVSGALLGALAVLVF